MHALEISNGEARFAYNGKNGATWHGLGVDVEGAGTVTEMLALAQADFTVEKSPLYVKGANGEYVEVEDKVATTRTEMVLGADGFTTTTSVLGVTGKTYAIDQNVETAEWALELVGAAKDDAVLDTAAVLDDGREFFASIDLGVLVLDPDGIRDAIKRHVCVRNRHDGGLSLVSFPTNIRVVCRNTATMAFHRASLAQQVQKIRHSSGKDYRKAQAVHAMGVARQLQELFTTQALQMIQTPGNTSSVTDVVKELWPLEKGATDRQVNAWNDRLDTIQGVYASPTCSQGFGDSAWTVWNAVTEYVDHNRKRSTEASRAADAVDLTSTASQIKARAAGILLGV